MAFIDIFTLIVITIMIVAIIGIFVLLGLAPGSIARKRNHPQAEAINIASWVFLIMGFAIWPFVLVWAFINTQSSSNCCNKGSECCSDKESVKTETNS